MNLKDKEAWDKCVEINYDSYGGGVVKFAEAWANLMESRMEAGDSIEKMAKETSHEANTFGITRFMYGCAVEILAQFWEHGEDLRRWSNLDVQINNEGEKANEEGGCLNPAILEIGDAAAREIDEWTREAANTGIALRDMMEEAAEGGETP